MNRANLSSFWTILAPLIVVAAGAATYGLIVLLRPLLVRLALVQPNARSSHAVPTPQGGGIAVVVATAAITMLAAGFALAGAHGAELAAVFGAAALLAVTGGVDDVRAIPPVPRLIVQVLAVALVVAAVPAELRAVPGLPWWIERALVVLAGVWFLNVVNFMDGVDWMSVAEIVPITAGLVVLGALGALPMHATVGALALGGAMLGFAPFNRPVARLFLGDIGSLPIGLLVGWMLLLLAGGGYLAAALLLPLYYLADATVTLAQRWRRGEKLSQAHRSHFYQRATQRGLSVMQVVTRVFAVNIGLVGLAVATVIVPGRTAAAAALVCGSALVGWLLIVFARGRR
jgi:UDP-N-acetylmuramyl pentapeptide phosphotransferase/UDP-N-acetylglucosamine-1-phosphate transferase